MTGLANRLEYAVAPRRVSVLPGEIGRLEHHAEKLQVVAGCGWLSSNGIDTILKAGNSFVLPTKRHDVPLISALDNTTLVLEFSRR